MRNTAIYLETTGVVWFLQKVSNMHFHVDKHCISGHPEVILTDYKVTSTYADITYLPTYTSQLRGPLTSSTPQDNRTC